MFDSRDLTAGLLVLALLAMALGAGLAILFGWLFDHLRIVWIP